MRGVIVAVMHCAIVMSVAGKYAMDRASLPRAWAKAAPVDPNLPIRGRYVSLNLQVDGEVPEWQRVALAARDGRLVATPSVQDDMFVRRARNGSSVLMEPVAFFLPEHAPDPSVRAPGEELWVEVSVPRRGPPRPVSLAVVKDGVRRPLDLR